MTARAATAGDPLDLDRESWRRTLHAIAETRRPEDRGSYESPEATARAIRRELVESKRALESRLGKTVDEFCYPWFTGSAEADRAAADAGYRVLHYGIDAPQRADDGLLRVGRVSEHFVRRLPGRNRGSLWSIVRDRLHGKRT